MAAKLIRLTHIIAIQLHLVAESCIICNHRSRKLLDTPSYISYYVLMHCTIRRLVKVQFGTYVEEGFVTDR